MNDNNENKEDIKFENDHNKQSYQEFKMPNFKLGIKHKALVIVIAVILIAFGLIIYMPIFNPVYKESIWIFVILLTALYVIIAAEKVKAHYIIGLYGLVFIALFLSSTPILWSDKYYNLLGDVTEETYSENPPQIDDTKIPVVDQALAETLGDKMLGDQLGLGSQYTVGEYYFITTKDDLAWVAPLEPLSFFKWFQNRDGAPGYVYVSATNPSDVRLVTELNGQPINLKYTNESYWFKNIKRHVYLNGNMTTGLTDFSFEIDDEGNPYWVVTTYAPAFNVFAGRQATGVVTVDAQTGELNKYSIDDEMPAWIERVWPTSFIMEQIEYNGYYKNGWLNSIITQKEMVMPTDGFSYVFMDGQPYLYTGITSVQSDQSTVGMMIVSLRDKSSYFYKLTGATENAAMASAEGQVQQYKYSATFPILLNVYNEPTYFMTLKDEEGLVKQYAYVSVENYDVVGIGDTVNKAKQDYYNSLKDTGKLVKTDTTTLEAQTKEVERINIIDGIAYIKFVDDKNFYMAETELSNELLLTMPGDNVTYKIADDSGSEIQILEFDNKQL